MEGKQALLEFGETSYKIHKTQTLQKLIYLYLFT